LILSYKSQNMLVESVVFLGPHSSHFNWIPVTFGFSFNQKLLTLLPARWVQWIRDYNNDLDMFGIAERVELSMFKCYWCQC
jgi:hypothetical protein